MVDALLHGSDGGDRQEKKIILASGQSFYLSFMIQASSFIHRSIRKRECKGLTKAYGLHQGVRALMQAPVSAEV